MDKVLRADSSVVDATVEYVFGASEPDVWVTYELLFSPAALAFWEGIFGSPFFDNIGPPNFGRLDYLQEFSGWITGFFFGGSVPTAGAYLLVEHHYSSAIATEVFINGVSVGTGSAGAGGDVPSVIFGLINQTMDLDPASVAYFRNPKIGTTRGGSEVFSDDFSSGDLSLWSSSIGDVTVVDDPLPPGPPPAVNTRPSVLRHFQHYEGPDAAKFKPGPTSKGMGWWATDTKIMYRSTGVVWEPIGAAFGSGIYVDERILAEDADSVLFDAFPPDLHVLELTWRAACLDTTGVIYLDFNGDTLDSAAEDYRWRLTLDPTGLAGSAGLGSIDDGDADTIRTGGGFGYVAADRISWGRVRFPAYTQGNDPINFGPVWSGDGGWDGGGGTSDAWTVAGTRDNGAVLASILVSVASLDVAPAPLQLAAGSWFCLTGY